MPKIHNSSTVVNGETVWKKSIRFNLARPRYIDATAVLDNSVMERMKDIPEYRPPNIKSFWIP